MVLSILLEGILLSLQTIARGLAQAAGSALVAERLLEVEARLPGAENYLKHSFHSVIVQDHECMYEMKHQGPVDNLLSLRSPPLHQVHHCTWVLSLLRGVEARI